MTQVEKLKQLTKNLGVVMLHDALNNFCFDMQMLNIRHVIHTTFIVLYSFLKG